MMYVTCNQLIRYYVSIKRRSIDTEQVDSPEIVD